MNGTVEWVGKFMTGRKERIEDNVPYVDVDFAGLLRELGL